MFCFLNMDQETHFFVNVSVTQFVTSRKKNKIKMKFYAGLSINCEFKKLIGCLRKNFHCRKPNTIHNVKQNPIETIDAD